MGRGTATLAMLALVGCARPAFVCGGEEACDGGTCQPNGYCSFPDPECDSGQRYGSLAGAGLAGRCVAPSGDTGSGGETSGSDAGGSTSSSTTLSTSAATVGSGTASTGETTPADWWDERWTRRQRLTVDGTGIGAGPEGVTTDVPVLVVFDADRVELSSFAADGSDVVFVDADGATVLAHEIDGWSAEGPSWAWVRVPVVLPGQGADLWLYYGNADAVAPDPEVGSVWNADFAGVWHLGATVEDAVDPDAPVSVVGATAEAGNIGQGCRFGGVDAEIDAGNAPRLADLAFDGMTISAWYFADSFGEAESGRIVDKTDAIAPTFGFSFEINDGNGNATLQFDRAGVEEGAWQATSDVVELGRWQHVVVTYVDPGPPVFYVDGVEVGTSVHLPWIAPADTDADASLYIGNEPLSRREFDGVLDEVRVSRGLRDATWVELEYLSGADQLVEFGPVETLPDGG